jgi:hypothetical protein
VDDFYGLDRIDRWLNSQRGPRRILLFWLDGMPLSILLTLALVGWQVMRGLSGASTPSPRAVEAVAIVLAVSGGFLMSGLLTLTLRLAQSGLRRFQPRFSWRRSSYSVLMTSWPTFNLAYFSIHGHWPVVRVWPLLLWMIMWMAMLFWNDSYLKRAARARLARAQGRMS